LLELLRGLQRRPCLANGGAAELRELFLGRLGAAAPERGLRLDLAGQQRLRARRQPLDAIESLPLRKRVANRVDIERPNDIPDQRRDITGTELLDGLRYHTPIMNEG
jgi:hypothetical protein